MCSFVYGGLDLGEVKADRTAEAIAGTDSDRAAEWELASTEGFSECDGSEVNMSSCLLDPLPLKGSLERHPRTNTLSEQQCGRMWE